MVLTGGVATVSVSAIASVIEITTGFYLAPSRSLYRRARGRANRRSVLRVVRWKDHGVEGDMRFALPEFPRSGHFGTGGEVSSSLVVYGQWQ